MAQAALEIAHVLTSLEVGGAEKIVLELVQRQIRAGHRVVLVSLQEPAGGLVPAFHAAGAEVLSVPKRVERISLSLVERLMASLRRTRVQVVHTHNALPLIYGAPAARGLALATVHTKHGVSPGSPRHMLLRRLAGRLPHVFAAVSEQTARDALAARECSRAQLRVVPNGVDLQRFRPDLEARQRVRRELGLGEGAWVIGSVGRLAAIKDFPSLVTAAGPLLGPEAKLVLVGDGPEAAAIDAAARASGKAEHVLRLGVRADVEACLNAFDVFALSSRSEGLPVAVAESMATGLPVVSTDVGGVRELVQDGVTGVLTPPGDVLALRAALTRLQLSTSFALQCGLSGRRAVEDGFSAERMTERYAALYREAVASVRARSAGFGEAHRSTRAAQALIRCAAAIARQRRPPPLAGRAGGGP